MPGIVRKLLICAAVDGLILQPSVQSNARVAPPLKIEYKTHAIGPWLNDVQTNVQQDKCLEAYGVIGLLKVAHSAYLISISRRQQVARIWGKPIYVITGISIIPIDSQANAQAAIDRSKQELAALLLREEAADISAADAVAEPDNDVIASGDSESVAESTSTRASVDYTGRSTTGEKRKAGIAEEVIQKKGVYGRFAERWFSKRGWATGQHLPMPMHSDEDLAYPDPPEAEISTSNNQAPNAEEAHQRWPQTPSKELTLEETLQNSRTDDLATSLLPKLINTTRLLFASRTFYFSYDFDLTHRMTTQRHNPSDLPLYKEVDSEYFWNNHLSTPFIEKGAGEFVSPIMQGFVGQRSFALQSTDKVVTNLVGSGVAADAPEEVVEAAVQDIGDDEHASEMLDLKDNDLQHFVLTLISRRSTYRAGLRYLRRGIDEEGHTANAVETEQILSFPQWDPEEKIHSFVQTRGSIPLFFSQIPYNFKPPPTLHGTPEANQSALRKHFAELANRYGEVHAISLIDKHGGELQIGEAYENSVKTLNTSGGINGKSVGFDWFEFHNVCRGMKFENVSILVDSMASYLSDNQWTIIQFGKPVVLQSGITRSNCMDCLDRTNVVQSAFAQRILEMQLATLGFSVNLTSDPSTTWFNTLWADNGDAVSRAYTGTSALKGDYTRTRKRNMVGALTDLSLTLSRYYFNLFDDFFAQAAIDYLLGTVTSAVFAEFEATMTTADPAVDINKARQAGITTASHIVVEESEDLLHGWVLRTPAIPNTLRTFPFTEAILLLSNRALYSVRFDWDASKVISFERIELSYVQSLQRGTYITETHAHAQIDPKLNVGFIVKYQASCPSVVDERGKSQLAGKDGQDDNAQELEETLVSEPRPPIVRVNSRALDNIRDSWSVTGADGREEGEEENSHMRSTRILAFKALALRSTVSKTRDMAPVSELENIKTICSEILNAADIARSFKRQPHAELNVNSEGYKSVRTIPIEERDVIGIGQAKASTGYLERVGWGIKKALWG